MPRKQVAERRAVHEGSRDDSVATAVVSSVATVAGVEPTALPPLQRSLDVDALEAVLGSAREGTATATFTYAGYRVTADSSGSIRVEETSPDR